ncbi:MAG: hypothetical protein AAFQ80_15490 [Cyanobacteria bacterium J06621_8]
MTNAIKFIPKLVKFGVLGLVLAGLNGGVTQAQRSQPSDGSIDLLSLGCSTSGQGKLVTDKRDDVSVGKRIFTPAFHFSNLRSTYNPSLITCKLNPSGQPQTMKLIVGIQDYAMEYRHEITFRTYLDGQPTASHVLSAGEGRTLLLDVSKTSSIALEAQCSFLESGYYCPSLYFLEASILPSPTSSLTNPNSTAFNETEKFNSYNDTDNPQTETSAVEESSWGNSTVGREEKKGANGNRTTGGSLEDTIEDVNSIINIFK